MSAPALLEVVSTTVGLFFAIYTLLLNSGFAFLTLVALRQARLVALRRDFAGYDEAFGEPRARGVSVLMPAYNEEATIVAAVQAMRALRYPDFEVVVIDDGSKDATVATLVAAFGLVEAPLALAPVAEQRGEVHTTYVTPGGDTALVLLAKHNGGKADALNAGLSGARKELVCMVDADSLLEPDALLHIARPFAEDPRVVAAGGVIRVANGSEIRGGRVSRPRMPRSWLARIQVVEYVRAFLVGRAGWSGIRGLLIISGAFGLFRADVVRTVGGLDATTLGEDAELVVRIQRWVGDSGTDGRVVFVNEPVAWTEVPEDLGTLGRQRRRWHRGLAEIFARHRGMILRRRYGVIGMVTMPWFWAFELLAPLVELAGAAYFVLALVVLGLQETGVLQAHYVDAWVVLLLLACALLYALLMTFVALLCDELATARYRRGRDLLTQLLAALVENLGYRQLTALWRARGLLDHWRKSRQEWGEMTRKGFSSEG